MYCKSVFSVVAVLLFAGCTSFTEIAKFPNAPATDDGVRPIGSIEITNVGYKFLFCLPIVSGTVWQDDGVPYEEGGVCGPRAWFRDKCTIDENLKGLHRALKEFPSRRVANVTTYNDSWSAWSAFLVSRRIIRTNCTVLSK